jgi:hypothetical protein
MVRVFTDQLLLSGNVDLLDFDSTIRVVSECRFVSVFKLI